MRQPEHPSLPAIDRCEPVVGTTSPKLNADDAWHACTHPVCDCEFFAAPLTLKTLNVSGAFSASRSASLNAPSGVQASIADKVQFPCV